MKKPKSEVDYAPGHKESHCGRVSAKDAGDCRYFLPGAPIMDGGYKRAGYCQKVLGPINRSYWCRLWTKHEPD